MHTIVLVLMSPSLSYYLIYVHFVSYILTTLIALHMNHLLSFLTI